MNQRILKEIKVLLPAFGLTLLAGAFPFLPSVNGVDFWMTLIFSLGCLFMGVEAFGNDLHHGTLSLLLTQPLPRGSIWKEKMQVLGCALTLSGLIAASLVSFSNAGNRNELLFTIAIVPPCVFLTSPFWTLLLRNTMAAMVFTTIVPAFIVGVAHLVCEYFSLSSKMAELSAVVLVTIYCGICCWSAYRRFGNYQLVDKQSMMLSRELNIPARFEAILRRLTAGSGAARTPLVALLKKELRLQQITFVAALSFWTLAIVGAVAHTTHITVSGGLSLAEIIWAFDFYLYVTVLPLLAGSIAVTEEKVWGVVDWQLTLPPSVFRQWCVKVFVTLGNSLLVGLVLPLALSWVGLNLLNMSQRVPPLGELAPILLGHLLLTNVAIYAACLSANTARAMIFAVGIVVLGAWSISLGHSTAATHREVLSAIIDTAWPSHLRPANPAWYLNGVALLTSLCLVQRFAYTAYRRRLTMLRRGLQLLTLAAFAWLVATIAFLL